MAPFEAGQRFDFMPMMTLREGLRQLRARAMLRTREGRTAEAWADLLACHRCARLFGQQPLVPDALIAVAIEGSACAGTTAFAQQGSLTAEQARQSLDDLSHLPKKWTFLVKWDYGDRICALSTAIMMATHEYPSCKAAAVDPLIAEALAELHAIWESREKARKAAQR